MRALYERGAWAVGLDLSPVLLEAARRNLSALQRQPRLVRAIFETIFSTSLTPTVVATSPGISSFTQV